MMIRNMFVANDYGDSNYYYVNFRHMKNISCHPIRKNPQNIYYCERAEKRQFKVQK